MAQALNIASIGILAFLFVMTIVVHEVSHGVVAYWRGDPTAKEAGRLSLNPLKHIDWFWTVLFPIVLYVTLGAPIGMAKPVPVDFSRLRQLRQNMIEVAIAGPLSNLILAVLLALLFRWVPHVWVLYLVWFNLGLAMFNLLPIPPLDGSKVLAGMLPQKWVVPFLRTERFGYLVILALFFSGIIVAIVGPPVHGLCQLLGVPSLFSY